MTRLSLRIRLTFVFALVMTVVLAAVGAFLYVRLEDELTHQLERRLTTSLAALQGVARENDGDVPPHVLAEEEVAQILGADGMLVAGTEPVATAPVLGGTDLADARLRTVVRSASGVLDDDPVLLVAAPLVGDGSRVVVVGASLERRNDALNGLLTQLAIGIPVAILLASVGGYALAGAALRPVEAMRERAETISLEEPGARLPLPHAHDEVRRLGETLNAMLQRLEDGLTRERRFVADASHELRTPLALLRTELDLALRRPRSHEDLERALGSASEEVERLTCLADDLLLLARSDDGPLPVLVEAVPLDELCATVACRFRPRADTEGRSIVAGGGDELVAAVDHAQLERALGNLVDNALGYGKGTVALSTRRDGNDAVLQVSDEGEGFPSAFLPVAFDRFARADSARTRASTGLGLAIVAAIAEAHGGSARVANGNGGGAIAEIRLPLSR